MADSEVEVVAVMGGDVDMLDALERAYRVGWNSRHVGSVRTVEERDERARGVAEEILADARPLATEVRPSGPDEAFVEWQRLQPSGHAEFFERNRAAAERQATLAQADGLARAMNERRAPDPGASSEPEESEQAMPDGLHWSERELWKAAGEGWIDGGEMRTVLARMAGLRAQVRRLRSAEPAVTDTQGCTHRMSSGAVSLTACGKCGAEPGDDCADRLEDREHHAVQLGKLTVNDVRYRRQYPEHDRRGAHAWLDSLGVPRHAEPEQQTDTADELNARRFPPATAPASCTERMAPPLVVVTDDHGLAHGEPDSDGEPPGMAHACPECNAGPGEPCADPLEDRIAYRISEVGGAANAMRHWREMAEQNERAFVHRELDLTGVPRHGTTTPADTSPFRTPEAEQPSNMSNVEGHDRHRPVVAPTPATHPMTTLYLAVIIYPYEGGAVLGIYTTEQRAHDALDAYDTPLGYDAETHPITVDHPVDIAV